MRINEAYEHEPLLSCTLEESPAGGCEKCEKTGVQCVDIAAPLTVEPTAVMGTVAVSCQGSPSVCCVTEPDGRSCTVTVTQQVCVSVPLRYGVTVTAKDPTITCAGSEYGDCRDCR